MSLSCTIFKIEQDIGQKLRNLLNPCLFNASDESLFPSKMCNGNGTWAQKTRMMVLTDQGKRLISIFSRLDTIHECDGQTDGHRPTASTAITHSVAR